MTAEPERPRVEPLLEEALDLHERGDLAAAERGYRSVLAMDPRQFTALHQLGVIANQRGLPEEALRLLMEALPLRPRSALARLNVGIALAALGRHDEALEAYQQAALLQPSMAEAHLDQGLALRQLGRPAAAVEAFDRALSLQVGAKALLNRALANQDLGRHPQALADFNQALELQPDDPDALTSRGALLQALHRPGEALADHLRALALDPDHLGALLNQGAALLDLKRPAEALLSLDRAISLQPDQADTHMNRGNALLQLQRLSEAVAEFDRSLQLRPGHPDAILNRGNALHRLGRHAEAIAACDQVLAADPTSTVAHSAKIFMLDYLPDLGFERHQAARRDYFQAHRARWPHHEAPSNDRDPDRRLVVGYVSADFCRHSAASCFGRVLEAHNHTQFEVVCYSGVLAEDDMTARFRRWADHWVPAAGLDDDQLAARIRQDRVDILVDLSGHSTGNRLPVFGRRPAPVQITAWGHGGGTGLPMVDHQFTDPLHIPAWARSLFAESSWDLPCCITYDPPLDAPPVNDLPALARGFVTFGSLNRSAKITPALLDLWARILATVPEARILLKDGGFDDPGVQDQVRACFAAAGIASERVLLRGHSSHRDHLAACHDIDIALDSFPQNGGITTWECLWMGVPVVALLGDHPACRLSGAILGALGMTGWVAGNDEEYLSLAISWAGRLQDLAELRRGLRTRISASAAGDPLRYTQAVESAYRAMWRAWVARSGQPGESRG